jgi:replication-associated recombination protein RarA
LLNVFELVVNTLSDVTLRQAQGDKNITPDSRTEIVTLSQSKGDALNITDKVVLEIVQQNPVLYDKAGDNHYDIISAFIKSIRGSDPNGAVYWLARMIEGGEDALFIARRMLIAASEDIGNANPTAMVVALNCFQAVNAIGYPEARIVLAQAATLPCDLTQEQRSVCGDQQGPRDGSRNRQSTRTAASAQCADKFDERHWLWQRVRILTRQGPAISLRKSTCPRR